MHRVLIDMDGPTVDFDGYMLERGLSADEVKRQPGGYLGMSPTPGAIEAIRGIIRMEYDVWLATKPPTGVAGAYAEKAQWVFDHLPELARRIIITHDKGMLGDRGDILIDDRIHKANCQAFAGTVLHYRAGLEWPEIRDILHDRRPSQDRARRGQLIVADHSHGLAVVRKLAYDVPRLRAFVGNSGVREFGLGQRGAAWTSASLYLCDGTSVVINDRPSCEEGVYVGDGHAAYGNDELLAQMLDVSQSDLRASILDIWDAIQSMEHA